ncbi:MAG: glycosyltransferase family 4 protein [Oscillospiraceae bacterium]|nr:glycosyltransferase family 4 protein [Oscillospiraceae bacterium]
MRILFVNKYLYQRGGAETYMLKLGEYMRSVGHEVQYFGMEDEKNIVGNSVGAYTDNIDFHKSSVKYITYPFTVIYSKKAAEKIRAVIEDFKPDIVHMNNFNYQLTPSIIYEIKKHNIPIVYTAHDAQLVCPNHRMKNGVSDGLCRRCGGGKFHNCVKNRCVHSSTARSVIGAAESWVYRKKRTYRLIDAVVCPSEFMERELMQNPDLVGRTMTLHNFIDEIKPSGIERENYVLYFGRYSEEKGIRTLIKAARALPALQFVFAGGGDMENEINNVENIRNLGFKSGIELRDIIEKAAFSVLASEWAENCPFTVMESQTLCTPVIGADIGGIPELIDEGVAGMLFESGNAAELTEKIEYLYKNKELCRSMQQSCSRLSYDTISTYTDKMIKIYNELIKK